MDSDLSRSLRLLAGIQEKLAGSSAVRIVPLHYNQADTLAHLVSIGSVDGVVGAFLGDRWLESLLSHHIPMVNVGIISDIHSIPSVGADFRATGVMAVRYFAESGWTNTAIVHEQASYASKMMYEGFIQESLSHGISPLLPPSGAVFSKSTGLEEWLMSLPEHTGCFCSSDFIARQIVGALTKAGRCVPDSIGVVGVGDSMLDSVLSPATLSTIVLPEREIGLRAVGMLLDMIENPNRCFPSERIPPTRIIVRESSAAYKYSDPVVNKAIAYMVTHLFSPCGTDTLAQTCGVSKRNLEMRFNATLNTSPATEWKRRRHQEICRLLAETAIPIKDIATMSGRAEASNFWNAFKKSEGVTPAKYRETPTSRENDIASSRFFM